MENDSALTLKEAADLLKYKPGTFRKLCREGWIAQWGIVELPRPPGGNRRFSAASVQRVLSGGIPITLRTRDRRKAS